MNAFDTFYEWCFPHIPSRDKIYAKLVELKVEQEKNKGASMTAIQKMVEWLEVMREKARAETKRGQVLAFAHTADKARRLASQEPKPVAEAGLVEELQDLEVKINNCSINGISKEINDLLYIASQKCKVLALRYMQKHKIVTQNVTSVQKKSLNLHEIWGEIYQRLLNGNVSYKELEAVRKVMDEIFSRYPPAPQADGGDGLREAAMQAADTLNCLMPRNPKSKKREWIWIIHNNLVKALTATANQDDKFEKWIKCVDTQTWIPTWGDVKEQYRKSRYRPAHSTTGIVDELRKLHSKFVARHMLLDGPSACYPAELIALKWIEADIYEIIRKFSNEKGGV